MNQIVPASEVIPAAIAAAKEITLNSPDAVQATKRGLLLSQEFGHSQMLFNHALGTECKRVYKGDNIKVRRQRHYVVLVFFVDSSWAVLLYMYTYVFCSLCRRV